MRKPIQLDKALSRFIQERETLWDAEKPAERCIASGKDFDKVLAEKMAKLYEKLRIASTINMALSFELGLLTSGSVAPCLRYEYRGTVRALSEAKIHCVQTIQSGGETL